MIIIKAQVDLDDTDFNNSQVVVPKNPIEYFKNIIKSSNDGLFCMNIDTLSTGCGGTTITFSDGPSSSNELMNGKVFGFVSSKKVLIEMKQTLELAIQFYLD